MVLRKKIRCPANTGSSAQMNTKTNSYKMEKKKTKQNKKKTKYSPT
jgi:hypothetical protein